MSSSLIWTIGAVYFIVALDHLRKGDLGFAIAFLGYAIGNIGLGMKS